GAEADPAVGDPVVGGLGLVRLPAAHLPAIARAEKDQLPAATEHGEPAAVGAVGHAPRLRRQRPPPASLPTLPVPPPPFLPPLRLAVSCVEGRDPTAPWGEGRVHDVAPGAQGRPGRPAGHDVKGPRASEPPAG